MQGYDECMIPKKIDGEPLRWPTESVCPHLSNQASNPCLPREYSSKQCQRGTHSGGTREEFAPPVACQPHAGKRLRDRRIEMRAGSERSVNAARCSYIWEACWDSPLGSSWSVCTQRPPRSSAPARGSSVTQQVMRRKSQSRGLPLSCPGYHTPT